MMVGEGAVDLGEDRVMVAGEELEQLFERRAGGAVAGVPAEPEADAAEVAGQAMDVIVDDVDIGDRPVAFAPVAGGTALAEHLDFAAKQGAAEQQHLEAVIVRRVVASGDLDAAVDVERRRCVIEHRAWPHADADDVEAAFGEAADQRVLEYMRMGAAVAADGDFACAFLGRERRIAAAEGISVRFVERVADDPADIVFAQDGGVESVGHCLANVASSGLFTRHCEECSDEAIQSRSWIASLRSQ